MCGIALTQAHPVSIKRQKALEVWDMITRTAESALWSCVLPQIAQAFPNCHWWMRPRALRSWVVSLISIALRISSIANSSYWLLAGCADASACLQRGPLGLKGSFSGMFSPHHIMKRCAASWICGRYAVLEDGSVLKVWRRTGSSLLTQRFLWRFSKCTAQSSSVACSLVLWIVVAF